VRLGRDIDVSFRDIRGPELALNGLLSFAGARSGRRKHRGTRATSEDRANGEGVTGDSGRPPRSVAIPPLWLLQIAVLAHVCTADAAKDLEAV
jgi:hypothetical protein